MNLHGFLFTYNEYSQKWCAATRDNYAELFSGGDNVIKSSSIETLIALINKFDGDIKKIKKNVK